MSTAQFLCETSLSRLLSHFNNRDIAMISASRSVVMDDDYDDYGRVKYWNKKTPPETKEDIAAWNNKKASILRRSAKDDGLTLIPVDGGYPEINGHGSEYEDSFFVISPHVGNFDHFLKIVTGYGKAFNQDSVFLKPKDGKAFVYGTNKAPWPGLDQKEYFSDKPSFTHPDNQGKEPYFTALKGKHNKRFSFKGVDESVDDPLKNLNHIVKQKFNSGVALTESEMNAVVGTVGGTYAYYQANSWQVYDNLVKNNFYPYGKSLNEAIAFNNMIGTI